MTDTDTDTTSSVRSFAELGVDERITEALVRDGITTPFPIQELTLPLALSGADVIGQARTGTGKTLAFGIPLLQRLDPAAGHVQALVIVPTRELCLQVHDDLALTGTDLGVRTVAVYGGKAIEDQTSALETGAQVVVGTPGRLLDLMRRGILRLGDVRGLVLDEADEMLDMGFLPDVEQLIEACADKRQTLLFSATMPSEVVGLARRYMHKPTFMRADVEEPRIAPETAQHFLSCHGMDKPAVLARILQAPGRGLCVVFTRTKRMADTLVKELDERGVDASAIHSDLRQEARERTLRRFREGKVDVLCATEVAARGLDISDVTHVINYDCPDDEKMYLHRIGRTGRAGAAGVAVTLAVWNELARLEMIKKALDIDVPTHEVFSTSPLLDELFELPPREVGRRQGRRGPGGKGRSGGARSNGGDRGDGRAAGPREASRGSDGRGGDDDPEPERRGSGTRRVTRVHRGAGSAASTEGGASAGEGEDAPRTTRARQRRRVEAPTISTTERDDDGEPLAAPGGAPAGGEPSDRAGTTGRAKSGDREGTSDRPKAADHAEADDDTGDSQRERVRRRTRERGAEAPGRQAVSSEDEADAVAGAGAGDGKAGGREPDTAETSDALEGPGDNGRPTEGRERSRSRGGRGRRGGRGGRGSGGGRSARTDEREDTATGRAQGSGDGAGSRGQRARSDRAANAPGGNRGGRGRSQGQGRGSDGGGRRSGARGPSEAAGDGAASSGSGGVPTSQEARGEGKPALNRPLRIAHLP